ncbi:MAG TPA: DNA ligase D [Steroidobacteraceae bacterium]|nr:DNA ligase D [Steroidobacteraceae bacterium]
MKSRLPDFIEPCLAERSEKVPSKGKWLYEIKFDGYRAQARLTKQSISILTRRGYDWTQTFSSIATDLKTLRSADTILDGEIVVLDAEGRSDFRLLQQDIAAKRANRFVYYVFDLLFLKGKDVRELALVERKKLLKALLKNNSSTRIRLSEHIEASGSEIFEHACQLRLEGIICKRLDAPYRSGRGADWVKVKCTKADHFPIVAFVEKLGVKPRRIASLYLGRYEDGRLLYAGKAQTGFTNDQLYEVRERLDPFTREESPLAVKIKKPKATWVEPVVEAQVEFSGRTSDGLLREPVFKGLRDDLLEVAPRRQRRNSQTNAAKRGGAPRENILQLLPDAVVPTKEQLVQYWERAGERALKYLTCRPLKLVRHVLGSTFYHKGKLPPIPPSVHQLKIEKREGGTGTRVWIDDVAGFLGLVEMDVIEVHAWNATVDDIERADQLVFDLDPGPGIEWDFVLETAYRLKDILVAHDLESWPKLSGGKGVHVMVPLQKRVKHDEAHELTKRIAGELARTQSKRYTTSAVLSERRGRLFIDYLRNGRGTTAVGTYSPRARQGFPIAAPTTWSALQKLTPTSFSIERLPPTRLISSTGKRTARGDRGIKHSAGHRAL